MANSHIRGISEDYMWAQLAQCERSLKDHGRPYIHDFIVDKHDDNLLLLLEDY